MAKKKSCSTDWVIDFSQCPTFLSLSTKEKTFVLEYLKEFHGTRAAQKAKIGGKAASQAATRLLKSVTIQRAMVEVSAAISNTGGHRATIADIQELREFWTRVVRGKLTEILEFNKRDGLLFVKDSAQLDPDTARLIKKIKVTTKASAKGDWTEVETNVEMLDPLKASELLGRSLGAFIDKMELTASEGLINKIMEARKRG